MKFLSWNLVLVGLFDAKRKDYFLEIFSITQLDELTS